MAWLHQLADVARRTGFPVVEENGWRNRGHGGMGKVRSVIAHHDAARHDPGTFNTVIRDGHSKLAGPLSHYALRRDGTIHVVAAGRCWHAGANINPLIYGNKHAIGIEAGNDGVGEPWPRRQLEAYEALCAELVREFGKPPKRVRGHKEIAPARKIDPHGINMHMFRNRVADYLARGNTDSEEIAVHVPMDPGGTLRPGGADGVAWRAVPVPFVGRERELLISPGEGEAAGVHIDTINTWKTINANQAAARWGASTSNPGGVGPLGRNMWVHRHASLRLVIPPDVGKIDVGYASDTSWSLTVAPI